MTPAPPPGWETRENPNRTLWRWRPLSMHVDLTLHPALPMPTRGKNATVRCVVLDASPWYRFESAGDLRSIAAAINAAADWLDTPAPPPDGQLTLHDYPEELRRG